MINFKHTFYISSFVTTVAALLCCCTFTAVKLKTPDFAKSYDSISNDISSIILSQEINYRGQEVTSKDKKSSELIVSLINPQALPDDSLERDKICEQVAVLSKNSLKNRNEFDTYRVLFVNTSTKYLVTKTSYSGKIFNSKDLAEHIYLVSVGDRFDSIKFQAVGKTTFSNKDMEIVIGFKYYFAAPNAEITVKLYKESNSVSKLLMARNIGQVLPGTNYVYNKLTVADFYSKKGLGSGDYRVEYLLNDSVVGNRYFKLL